MAATVWLYRDLPDPTPPSRRLKPAFARQLARVSARNHVDWALALAVLRARGDRGAVPASGAQLRSLTKRLAHQGAKRDAWGSVLSLEGKTSFADRTIALKNLYRAVGLKALVKGFDWDKPRLEKQILNDKRITIYPGGRDDIANHRVNVRVLALIAYLAEAHGQVTVSCLISGHRLYARPGVISAHIYGLAADISDAGRGPDPRAPAAGRLDHREGRAEHPAAPGRDAAAAGHLAARPRRTLVPAGEPLRPHSRWLLEMKETTLTRADGTVVCERARSPTPRSPA